MLKEGRVFIKKTENDYYKYMEIKYGSRMSPLRFMDKQKVPTCECVECGRPCGKRSKYCSDVCRETFYDKKHGTCKNCDNRLTTKIHPDGRRVGVIKSLKSQGFCGIDCRAEYHAEHRELWKPCLNPNCGKLQNQWVDLVDGKPSFSKSQFCSDRCRKYVKQKKENSKPKRIIARRMRDRLVESLKLKGFNHKSKSLSDSLPWSYAEYSEHLLSTLPAGLELADCHIDHIVPQVYFDFDDTMTGEDFVLCWCPWNLQLVPIQYNLDKNSSYLDDLGPTIKDAKDYLREKVSQHLTNKT